jgi:CHAT domain-containing protein
MPGRIFALAIIALALIVGNAARAQDADALAFFEGRARAGDVEAMRLVGDVHANGLMGPKDPGKALLFYGMAIAAGDAKAAIDAADLRMRRLSPGDPEEAIALYRLAFDRYGAAGVLATPEIARARLKLGDALATMMRLDEAIAEYRAVETIFRLIPIDHYTLAYARQGLGSALHAAGRSAEAFAPLALAREDFAKAPTREPNDVAIPGFDVEGVRRATNGVNAANTFLTEGLAHDALGDYAAARIAYARAAADTRSAAGGVPMMAETIRLVEAVVAANTAWLDLLEGDAARAHARFLEALPGVIAINGESHLATARVRLGLARAATLLGRQDEAMRLLVAALTVLKRTSEATLNEQRGAYKTLSMVFAAKGDRRRAILMAKQAVNAHERIRTLNPAAGKVAGEQFDRRWRDLYTDLADLLIAEGRHAEAQSALDLLKRREVFEFVRRDGESLGGDAALTDAERRDAADLEALMDRPMALQAELAEIERAGGGSIPAEQAARAEAIRAALDRSYAGFVSEVDAILAASEAQGGAGAAEVAALNLDYAADYQEELRSIGRPAALLQIASLDQSLHLFLTTPEISVHRSTPIAREAVSRMVFEALQAIEARSPEADARLAALYDVLIRPIAPDLAEAGAETIMLNLEGFLRYTPFAALRGDGRYLVEDYALAWYTPAARTRFERNARDAASSAGFGVTRAHRGFSALPAVRAEIESIFGGPLSGPAHLDEGFDASALRAALRARPTLVHIASHFRFAPGDETDSFLLLGDGEPLSLAEIRKGRGFRFGGVDLLTLSACETARGGGADGGEVESFGALAQMNGASAVMATLWPIADDSTARLMADFYARLLDGGATKAQALRGAQLAMLRSGTVGGPLARGAEEDDAPAPGARTAPDSAPRAGTAHPYFWAPFVLMGNWL